LLWVGSRELTVVDCLVLRLILYRAVLLRDEVVTSFDEGLLTVLPGCASGLRALLLLVTHDYDAVSFGLVCGGLLRVF
jgi:hypothetical protein